MKQEWVVIVHIVSNKGIEVEKAKVEVIEKLPPPTLVKGVKSFVWHVNFYWRFIKDFSKIAKPLTHLLVKDVPFEFDEECLSSYLRLKEVLISAPVMQKPWIGNYLLRWCVMQVTMPLEKHWAKERITSHMPYILQVRHLMKLKWIMPQQRRNS